VWIGIDSVRWFEAEAGVRISKMRRVESLDTEERIDDECGECAALYVHEWVGSVRIDSVRRGVHLTEGY
jgi:hypothetical protein